MDINKLQFKNKGFTLVELMVVISIIGIIVSIVLVSLGSARGKAKDAVTIAHMKELAVGLYAYYEEGNEVFPWGWENGSVRTGWQDTPCNPGLAPCDNPGDICKDYSNSNPEIFLQQLVSAGYFSDSSMDSLLKNHIEEASRIEYWYSCDLKDFMIRTWLSDGTEYAISTINYYNRWYYNP